MTALRLLPFLVLMCAVAGCRRAAPAPAPVTEVARDAASDGWMARDEETGLQVVGRERTLNTAQAAALDALSARPWVRRSHGTRVDYLDAVRLEDSVVVARPRTTEEAVETVRTAANAGLPMRIQGHSHSMNGASLAAPYELQINTTQLRDVCATATGVRAGAGISMVGLDLWLNERGWKLPVRNDGGYGPSVGGYIAAGGFGVGSAEYGGFWSNVRSIDVVDGRGELRTIASDDPRFPWFFGAGGQLGLVVAAELDVVPLPGSASQAPLEEGACEREPGNNEFQRSQGIEGYMWWSLFTPVGKEAAVVRALQEIQDSETSVEFLRPYRYPVRHRGVYPRLLLPVDDDVVVVGIWMTRPPRDGAFDSARVEAAHRIDMRVTALAKEHNLRRYLIAETAVSVDAWRTNLGEETYLDFLAQ